MWQFVGVAVSPLKHTVFRLLSLVHRTTRPRVAIICGSEVLLVRNWGDRRWSLPGGGAHGGETPQHAAQRECHEELGVDIPEHELEFVTIVEQNYYTAPVYRWKTTQKSVLHPQKLEITGVRWMAFDEIEHSLTEVDKTVSALIL